MAAGAAIAKPSIPALASWLTKSPLRRRLLNGPITSRNNALPLVTCALARRTPGLLRLIFLIRAPSGRRCTPPTGRNRGWRAYFLGASLGFQPDFRLGFGLRLGRSSFAFDWAWSWPSWADPVSPVRLGLGRRGGFIFQLRGGWRRRVISLGGQDRLAIAVEYRPDIVGKKRLRAAR